MGPLTSIQTPSPDLPGLGSPRSPTGAPEKVSENVIWDMRSPSFAPYIIANPKLSRLIGTPAVRWWVREVWMGEHQGRWVAVKVLKVYSTSAFDKVTKVGYLSDILNVRTGKLTMARADVLQGSHDMEPFAIRMCYPC